MSVVLRDGEQIQRVATSSFRKPHRHNTRSSRIRPAINHNIVSGLLRCRRFSGVTANELGAVIIENER